MVIAIACILAACRPGEWPIDPERTLERARGGSLNVGAVHAPPWLLVSDNGEARGPEAEFLEELARALGATLVWHRGAPEQLALLTELRELDILAGGFESDSPLLEKLGRSRPLIDVEWWVVATVAEAPASLRGHRVSVRHGRAAALVRRQGGQPVVGRGHREALRAVPRLRAHDRLPGRAVSMLGTTEHVLGFPPGENAWAVAVDRQVERWRRKAAAHSDAETDR